MEWIESIDRAIRYIEEHMTETLSIDDIAKEAFLSPFYFQKGFSMLCGFTVGEYIRRRRLTLAGNALLTADDKILDIALKYGYESPDSFTKAFTRFHGVTPTAVRKNGAMIKLFAPLKIKVSLEGGYIMDYRIVEKAPFTVMGISKVFQYESAVAEIPKFWDEYFQTGKNRVIRGKYGINVDESMGGEKFTYWIADDYAPSEVLPDGVTTKVIPQYTWAVFACRGAMPNAMQDVERQIFSEWLPNCEYEFAAGYNIELYNDPANYPNGIQDEAYYSEVWIPVKAKQHMK